MKKLIAFGDSLAFGWGVDRAFRFTTLLEGYAGFHVVNRGKAAERTDEIRARFALQVLDAHPDVLFLIGGSNDIFQKRHITEAFRNLTAMTEEVLEAGTHVLLATTPPYCFPFAPPYWSEIVDLDRASSEIRSLNDMLRSYVTGRGEVTHFPNGSCGRKMPNGTMLLLCDLAADFLALPEAEYRTLFTDEIHPNKKGHARYAACIRACLDQL